MQPFVLGFNYDANTFKMNDPATKEILGILSSPGSPQIPDPDPEQAQSTKLRQQAREIISGNNNTLASLPTTLLELLTQIIKTLFTATKHPALTSTGRKNLVTSASQLGSSFTRFHDIAQDEAVSKPWKSTSFTVPLLRYILKCYSLLPLEETPRKGLVEAQSKAPREAQRKSKVESQRKTTIEAHFHLLVPPILNLIDDRDAQYKAAGCALLHELCDVLVSVRSDMLKRTGLGDVFVDALKANLMLLPPLTPEEESLEVLGELYPAFLALVDAQFVSPGMAFDNGLGDAVPAERAAPPSTLLLKDHHHHHHLSLLSSTIYRHGILASLTHLSSSVSGSLGSTISVPVTTLILTQIPPVFTRLGISCVKHLRSLLPMLRVSLMDPFTLAAPQMTLAILEVLECVVKLAEARVRDRWYPEILRGVVGCWCNCIDDQNGSGSEKGGEPKGNGSEKREESRPENGKPGARLKPITDDLKRVVGLLGQVVPREEWEDVKDQLRAEDGELAALFGVEQSDT